MIFSTCIIYFHLLLGVLFVSLQIWLFIGFGQNSRTTIDGVFGYIRLFEGDRFLDQLIKGLFQFISFGLVGLHSSSSSFP